jgi:hypothetical protein
MPTARGADAAPIDELLPPGAGPTPAAVAALDGAIAAAFGNFGSLAKDGDNTYLKTSYLTLPTLLDAVRPALMAQGVLITSALRLVPGGFVCQTTLQHSGGGWRSSQFPVGDPGNAQKVAAAATYGLRINLQQLLAITGQDDDGQPQQFAPATPAYAVSPQQPAQQHQHWAAPAPQGGYDMTQAIPQHEIAAAVAAAQQQPNALQYQPTPTDPSAYV